MYLCVIMNAMIKDLLMYFMVLFEKIEKIFCFYFSTTQIFAHWHERVCLCVRLHVYIIIGYKQVVSAQGLF